MNTNNQQHPLSLNQQFTDKGVTFEITPNNIITIISTRDMVYKLYQEDKIDECNTTITWLDDRVIIFDWWCDDGWIDINDVGRVVDSMIFVYYINKRLHPKCATVWTYAPLIGVAKESVIIDRYILSIEEWVKVFGPIEPLTDELYRDIIMWLKMRL